MFAIIGYVFQSTDVSVSCRARNGCTVMSEIAVQSINRKNIVWTQVEKGITTGVFILRTVDLTVWITCWCLGPIKHTVKSTVRRMNTPVLITFSTWDHTIFSCLWTVLLFLTWLYIRFWLYKMQKHPHCEKHSPSLQTWPVIRFATI